MYRNNAYPYRHLNGWSVRQEAATGISGYRQHVPKQCLSLQASQWMVSQTGGSDWDLWIQATCTETMLIITGISMDGQSDWRQRLGSLDTGNMYRNNAYPYRHLNGWSVRQEVATGISGYRQHVPKQCLSLQASQWMVSQTGGSDWDLWIQATCTETMLIITGISMDGQSDRRQRLGSLDTGNMYRNNAYPYRHLIGWSVRQEAATGISGYRQHVPKQCLSLQASHWMVSQTGGSDWDLWIQATCTETMLILTGILMDGQSDRRQRLGSLDTGNMYRNNAYPYRHICIHRMSNGAGKPPTGIYDPPYSYRYL